jgi:tetratricopeptide (TPR) repeat protein
MRPTSALLVLCLISVPVFAATHVELAAAGRAALERGDFEKAANLYEQAIKLNPKNAEYHYYLGAAYGEMALAASVFGKASLAKKIKAEFETAVKLDPNFIEARLGLVDYYSVAPGFMGGDPAKALEQAAEIKKRDNIEGHRAYARVHARAKKIDLARKEFVDAVRENPASAKAHYLLATFLVNEKNWTGALQEIEAALKLDPGYMPAHYRLGALAAQSGQHYSRGEEGLRRYLAYKPGKNEPSLAYAWYFLGMIQEKQGKKAEAKASYANARKLAPNAKDIAEALKRVS